MGARDRIDAKSYLNEKRAEGYPFQGNETRMRPVADQWSEKRHEGQVCIRSMKCRKPTAPSPPPSPVIAASMAIVVCSLLFRRETRCLWGDGWFTFFGWDILDRSERRNPLLALWIGYRIFLSLALAIFASFDLGYFFIIFLSNIFELVLSFISEKASA